MRRVPSTMASRYSLPDLQRLARDAGVPAQEPLAKLPSLSESQPRSFKTPVDEQRAELILQDQISSGDARKPLILTRNIGKRRVNSYKFKNTTAALITSVEQEAPGVIQALLETGGDLSVVKNPETKRMQTEKRSRLLLLALRAGREDTVALLAPQSPRPVLNEALTDSIRLRSSTVTSTLLQCGADPNECKAQFAQAVSDSDFHFVSLLLRAPIALNNETLLDNLTTAVTSGSLQIVKLLAGATDLSREQRPSAVREAVDGDRLDLLLAILPHATNIDTSFLDELVLKTFQSEKSSVDVKASILEALCYSGAHGSNSSAAFVLAVERQPFFIDLFAKHNVDINWSEAKVVRQAMKSGDSDVVRRVLRSGGLRADSAAKALECVPRNAPPTHRLEILKMLLEANPRGPSVDEQLVFAVQDGVEDAIVMLRNHGASLDDNDGDALVEAIQREQVNTVRQLLSRAVNEDTLAKAFPHMRRISTLPKRLMTGLLLEGKAGGAEVHAALRDAICDEKQDSELIDLLIRGGADPTYQNSQSLRHAISTEDAELLRKLLNCPGGVSSNAISSLVTDIARSRSPIIRREMLQDTIEAGANEESLSRALCSELSNPRCNNDIVQLLISRSDADPNFENGKSLCLAVIHSDETALGLLAASEKTARASRRNAIVSLIKCGLGEYAKASRMSILVDVKNPETIVIAGLNAQVEACRTAYTDGRQWPLGCFYVLLDAKPDLELDGGEAIMAAISANALSCLKLLLKAKLSQPTMKRILIHCLTIVDQADRLEICRTILRATVASSVLSAALTVAAKCTQIDVCEELLIQGADIEYDQHSPIRYAVHNVHLLRVMLATRPQAASLAAAFTETKGITAAEQRLEIVHMILTAGLRGDVLDQYLISVVEQDAYDPAMVQMLLDHEASPEADNCQSVKFASTNCKLELVQQLWVNVVSSETPRCCFEACIDAGLVRRHSVDILHFLLDQGARGPSLHRALSDAVTCLENRYMPSNMVTMLLSFGADPNFQDGLPLCCACQLGRIDAVEALVMARSSAESRTQALHHVLRSDPQLLPSQEFCKMITIVAAPRPWDSGFPELGNSPLFLNSQTGFDPAVRVLLEKRRAGTEELSKILDLGCRISSKSSFDLVAWAMARKISPQCIELLLERGANSRFVDAETGESLILMAIRTRKSGLLKALIRHHADVSHKDRQGRSPLLLAVYMGDAKSVAELLAARPVTDDGSLHQAVHNLSSEFVELLLNHDHDPTLPSPYHGRRTPLAELVCFVQATPSNLDKIREIVLLLKHKGADITKPIAEKPLICLALDNSSHMAEALLRAYLSKLIDEDFNLYYYDRFCCSPTAYVSEKLCLGPADQLNDKWNVLKAYGATRNAYYAVRGRQPPYTRGMPEHIRVAEQLAREKEEREAEEEAAHQTRLRRMEQLAQETERHKSDQLEQQLERNRHIELEEQQTRQQRHDHSRALRGEEWEDEQNREFERLRIAQQSREEDLEFQESKATAALSQQQRLYSAEQEHHKQIKYQDCVSFQQHAKVQKSLERNRDTYNDNQHQRRMEELLMAEALPIGAPYISPALEGPSSPRLIEYN